MARCIPKDNESGFIGEIGSRNNSTATYGVGV
jgi:hypothetical protein